MRGAFGHDALYWMLRAGLLPKELRKKCDQLLREWCREDGMSAIRAYWVYKGVRLGGRKSAKLGKINPVLIAP